MTLTGGAGEQLARLVPPGRTAAIHLSLTDDHPYAQAFVIIESLPDSRSPVNIGLSRRDMLAAAAACAAAPAWGETPPTFEPQALKTDAELLRRAVEVLHPGRLRYNTPAELDGRFAALRAGFDRPRTLGDAHLAFARLTGGLRCGHTFLNPSNQTGAALALNGAGRTRLPFRFLWLGSRMIVIGGPAGIPAGTEVLSIDGVPAAEIQRRLMPFAPADGHNDAKRIRSLELRGEEEWELFDVYFPLVFPRCVATGAARLALRAPDGRVRTLEVQLLTRAERAGAIQPGVVTRGSAEPAWRLERLANGAGWLTMRTWAVFDSKWDWRAALNESLDQLAAERAPALVVDLRGNAGGLDVGDEILARLVDRDTPRPDYLRKVRYRRTPADLDPHLETWDRSFRDWGDKAQGPEPDGFYRLVREDDGAEAVIRPHGRRFVGRLIVLTDAANSSATFNFCEAVKTAGLGTLVGETTGGSRRGINGGAFFFLRLPGSGLEIDLPLIGTFPAAPQPDAGVVPDHAIAASAADIAAGRDVVREAAIRLASA